MLAEQNANSELRQMIDRLPSSALFTCCLSNGSDVLMVVVDSGKKISSRFVFEKNSTLEKANCAK